MSEEILKALMELFAILAKQDQCIEQRHIDFVRDFLNQQLPDEMVEYYFHFFEEKADLVIFHRGSNALPDQRKLTSVKDSVKILGICKKINKTLVQEQKIIVLVRLFELINVDKQFTQQRMAILNTVAEVFKVDIAEFKSIENFILDNSDNNDQNMMIIDDTERTDGKLYKYIKVNSIDKPIRILRIPSVDLYILSYAGNENIMLNGMTLNNQRIHVLAKGSSIKTPKNKPIFYSDIACHYMAELHSSHFSFEANHISYIFPNGTVGIHDVSFSEAQGKLLGIMGASGAGKTTLLNVLCGLEKPSSGEIIINGINLHKNKEQLQSVIGYIPQDDLLIEELTVFENLYFNAKFCFREKTEEQLTELVDNTLNNLGLLEIKDLKVGSPLNKTISGGQRKRLNIALELIREPSILFVDEPTSGLSSRDSENVMDLLRELTLKGKQVLVVIHQPSSEVFKMFDKIVVLDSGGYMIYYGNPVESVIYFRKQDGQINSNIGECPMCGNVHPEQIFNIVEAKVVDEYGNYTNKRKVEPTKWADLFIKNIKTETVTTIHDKLPEILNVPDWFHQFLIYLKRDFRSKISNTQYIVLNMVEAPILGFILSFIIYYIDDPNSSKYIFRENDNVPIYIFMSLIVALFLGLTVSAEEIFRDRKILRREAFLNLNRSSYLLSKVAILFCISAIQSFLFIVIANSILSIKGMYFTYWFALFTTAAFANLLGLNISASFNSAVTIYIVIPLIMIPMMVLSGAMFSFEKLNRCINNVDHTPLIADLMPTKWSYEALMVHQFKNNKYAQIFYPFEEQESIYDFKQVYYLPEIEKYLENVHDEYMRTGRVNECKNDLILVASEINNQIKEVKIKQIKCNEVSPDSFNEVAYRRIKDYLAVMRNYYSYKFNQIHQAKEEEINSLLKQSKEQFRKLNDDYFNESVSDIVTKTYEKNKIIRYKNRLIQNYDPIYLEPRPKNIMDFRSQFMAPVKKFLGFSFDTFWFNMLIIWVYAGLLYVTLYYELFKKIVNLSNKSRHQ